jgi:hypothetical protein
MLDAPRKQVRASRTRIAKLDYECIVMLPTLHHDPKIGVFKKGVITLR